MSSIELMLCIFAANAFFSSFMWTFTAPADKWLWFLRFSLGIICLGFAGVMREIRKSRK